MWSHDWALSVKMSRSGLNTLGSSRLPARIVTRSSREPGYPNMGEPHSRQNASGTRILRSVVVLAGETL